MKVSNDVALREDISASVVCNRHFQTVWKSLKPALTREEVNSYSSFMKNPSLISSGSSKASAKQNSKHTTSLLGSVSTLLLLRLRLRLRLRLSSHVVSSSLRLEPSKMWNALTEISDSEFTLEEVDILKKNKNIFKDNIPRKEVEQFFANLPEDIIFEILVKVPARDLHENVRLVCKAWKGMISTSNFIAQNALQVKPKLLIQSVTFTRPWYVKVKAMEVDEERLDYKLSDFELPQSVRVRSSCNALGFDPCTKKYKVVHICTLLFHFEIFTIDGSDNAWKRVCGPWEHPFEWPFDLDFCLNDPVLVNERFVHWYVNSDEYVISIDLSNERVIKTHLPDRIEGIDNHRYTLLELDGYLSLVHNASNTQIDVWILEDFHSQIWLKKHSILAESIKYTISNDSSSCSKQENAFPNLSKLVPLASTRKGEILIFKHKSSGTDFRFYLYETKNREMKKFKMTIRAQLFFIPHASSCSHWRTSYGP
ncbi:F-box protein [Camellia lanceoleosa]|uniref:F-box protein n=1 Tax=Camellia lanceoleosa TaxID=1840588 RepID=A0ACC0HN36_9ERIC|nr:F-box protein [Camellia lanceoleosa]